MKNQHFSISLVFAFDGMSATSLAYKYEKPACAGKASMAL
jgi:hypothetical protein